MKLNNAKMAKTKLLLYKRKLYLTYGIIAVFLLDPDDPGETEKPRVITGSGDGSPPAGFRRRAPGGGFGGKAPENVVCGLRPQKLNRFS